jgi:TatD DNase family protein
MRKFLLTLLVLVISGGIIYTVLNAMSLKYRPRSIGTFPYDTSYSPRSNDISFSRGEILAIGETGLDYFRDQSPETKEKQVEIFKKHIALAVSVNKPLMLHVRSSKGSDDAYYDALEILSQYKNIRADFHFFSGSKQCMLDIIAAGFTISVDGPITFVAEYDDMIRACPIDKVMIETDAPFAAPAPYRGKTCEPWMVVEIARKVAELKGLDLETVRIQMLENTQRFFGIQA